MIAWTVAYQAPLSMEFSWQEYGDGLPFPSPADLLDLGIEPISPALQADALTPGTWVRSLGREDPLEKEMVTHSSILAWRIPWMEKPGRLQSMGSQRVRHN